MDIEKTVKAFIMREQIPFSESPREDGNVITCDLEGDPYRVIIDEKKGLLSIIAFVATDEIAIAEQIIPKMNVLNQTMFGTFSWHIVKFFLHVFSCRCDQLCVSGITVNEQLVEDIFVEVHKGIAAIKSLLN